MSAQSLSASVFLVIIIVLRANGNSNLNTFKVTPSFLQDDYQCCGGTNVTFPVPCGVQPSLNVHAQLPVDVASFGEFPWQVAILDAFEHRFLCSGVLLSAKTVLTAARCVSDVPTHDIRVRLGDWDILGEEDPRETYRSVEIQVSKKYHHPGSVSILLGHNQGGCSVPRQLPTRHETTELNQFKSGTIEGQNSHQIWLISTTQGARVLKKLAMNKVHNQDLLQNRMSEFDSLTLLKLRKSVNFGQYPHILPICLPAQPGEMEMPLENQLSSLQCYVTGWSESTVTATQLLYNAPGDSETSPSSGKRHADSTRHYFGTTPPPCRGDGDTDPESESCYTTKAPEQSRQQQHKSRRSNAAPNASQKWSRILGKSLVHVTAKDECSPFAMDFNELDASSLCLFDVDDQSQPCKADIGTPLVCQLPTELQRGKKKVKPGREDDTPPQFGVFGIVTNSFSCKDVTTNQQKPVIATSILKVLGQICKVAGVTKH